jgi:hypothetical protein
MQITSVDLQILEKIGLRGASQLEHLIVEYSEYKLVDEGIRVLSFVSRHVSLNENCIGDAGIASWI